MMAALTLVPTDRTFTRWLGGWSRVVLFGCGIRVRRDGPVPDGPAVLVANHQAMLDIPALTLGVGAPFVFVARRGLRSLPGVGGVLARSRCIFLDKSDPEPAIQASVAALADGISVLYFPEGTRGYSGELGRFYSGAFRVAERAGVPVVPIGIDGVWRIFNERAKLGRPGRVTVRVGAPIPPADPALLCDAARTSIETLLA